MNLDTRFLTVSFVALLAIGTLACTEAGEDTAPGAGGTTGTDGSSGFQVGDGQSMGASDVESVVPDTDDATEQTELLAGQICPPSVSQCVDNDLRRECSADGMEWVEALCGSDKKCWQGQCSAIICSPGVLKNECGSPTAQLTCNDVGTHFVQTPCDSGETCFEGQCVNYLCQPDAVACVGFGAVQQCRSDGSGWDVVEQCEKGGTCDNGSCVSACDVDLKAATYTGCEYFAVDLDNIEGGQFEPVAIVVSVPATVENSVVSIRNMATGLLLTPAQLNAVSLTVAAGTLAVFNLPTGQDIDGSGLWPSSFHIRTSAPATVHQFNPLNGDEVYTNDASLLLPTAVAGTLYYVMSWPMRKDEFNTLRGFATVVASEPGQTLVTITPRSDVSAGVAGVDFIAAGTLSQFVMNQGDVLNIETEGVQGADLTGTRIEGDQAISVFGGHECANVPLSINACDHLESQLVPVRAWGNRYVADVFQKRSNSQFDIFRVMAGATDVMVETNPPQPGYEKFLLQPGAHVTFAATNNFEVTATGRILVGHYMTGSSYPGHVKACGNTGIGDPAFTLPVPTQQFLSKYTVLTPPGYIENYLNIVAPSGAEVTVDGEPLSVPLSQVGPDLDWAVAKVPVTAGVHEVSAKKKIGLTAYGYDCDVSYAYPGGLRLLKLGD